MEGAKALDVLSDFQIEEMHAMQPIDLGLLSSKDNCHKKRKKEKQTGMLYSSTYRLKNGIQVARAQQMTFPN